MNRLIFTLNKNKNFKVKEIFWIKIRNKTEFCHISAAIMVTANSFSWYEMNRFSRTQKTLRKTLPWWTDFQQNKKYFKKTLPWGQQNEKNC